MVEEIVRMKITETKLEGCFLIEPSVFPDARGEFFESYNKAILEKELDIKTQFVQDNHSISHKGVLRGLHYQENPNSQAKLVRVVAGAVLDVVVDIRTESPTFGMHYKVKLSEVNKRILYIPRGMAHGFLALEAQTVFVYKCDNYYHKEAERGIIFNDPDLQIDWEYPEADIILSEKDRKLPALKSITL